MNVIHRFEFFVSLSHNPNSKIVFCSVYLGVISTHIEKWWSDVRQWCLQICMNLMHTPILLLANFFQKRHKAKERELMFYLHHTIHSSYRIRSIWQHFPFLSLFSNFFTYRGRIRNTHSFAKFVSNFSLDIPK